MSGGVGWCACVDESEITDILLKAFRYDRFDIVRFIIERNKLNIVDILFLRKGKTLLHKACKSCNDVKIVKYLVEKGLSVNDKDLEGKTPLYYSADKPEISKYLVEKGACVNIAVNSKKVPRTPLEKALASESLEAVKVLVENGADISCVKKPSESGRTKRLSEYLSINGINPQEGFELSFGDMRKIVKNEAACLYTKQDCLNFLIYFYKNAKNALKKTKSSLTKEELRRAVKKMPFNHRFFNDQKIRNILEFAIENKIEDRNGRSTLEACIIFCRNKDTIDNILSKTFSSIVYDQPIRNFKYFLSTLKTKSTVWSRISKFLLSFVRRKKRFSRKKITEIKSGLPYQLLEKAKTRNKIFYKQLLNKIYNYHIVNKFKKLSSDVSREITSY